MPPIPGGLLVSPHHTFEVPLHGVRGQLEPPAVGDAVSALRKAIVEPVFGQIKEGRGFRRVSFRALGTRRLML